MKIVVCVLSLWPHFLFFTNIVDLVFHLLLTKVEMVVHILDTQETLTINFVTH